MNFVFKIFMFSIFIFNISCLPGGSSFGGVFGIRTAPEKSIYAFDLGQETFQGKTENFLKTGFDVGCTHLALICW